jgi:hypothetical protein
LLLLFFISLHSVGMAFSYTQIISMCASLPVAWPGSLRTFFTAISAANMNAELFTPECSFQMGFWDMLKLKLMMPFIMFAFILFYAMLYKVVSNETFKLLYSRILYASTVILLHGYTFLLAAATEPLNCVNVSVLSKTQLFTVANDPNTMCYDSGTTHGHTHTASSCFAHW